MGKDRFVKSEYARQLLVLMLFCGVGLVGYACYAQAQGLTWQFDDLINLRGLEGVSSWSGLQSFVFGGVAGPGGRPLALLSFVPDYPHWPGNPWGMVRGALSWHLMNALLVFLLARVLLTQQKLFAANALLLAATVAAVWALLAMHASGLLMPVQRMVHVSAFYVLLTLLGYCYLRIALAGRGGLLGTTLLAAWVAVGTLVAVLGKESGAIVPAFVAIIELLLLRHLPAPCNTRLWRLGIWGALLVVPFALVVFMWRDWQAMQAVYLYQRDFTLWERMATQVIVLWEYLQQTLIPRASALGPFHDGHKIYAWLSLPVLAGVTAWIAVWVIAVRTARSGIVAGGLLLFALSWFFAAQQIESSFIPLELYFEHRNYLASLGVVAAVVLSLAHYFRTRPELRLLLGLGAGVLILLQLFALQQITSLWGQPLLAAEMWHMKHPNSMRAAQTLSWQYGLHAFDKAALRVLDDYADAQEGRVGARIQALGQACELEETLELHARLSSAIAAVPMLQRPGDVVAGLAELGRLVRDGRCQKVDLASYQRLLEALLDNRKVAGAVRVRHHVYYELALTLRAQGDAAGHLRYAKLAFADFPAISLAQMIATTHFEQWDMDGALAWLDEAIEYAPSDVVAQAWTQELAGLRKAILQVREQLQSIEQHEAELQPDEVD